jgi:hypothetical protein
VALDQSGRCATFGFLFEDRPGWVAVLRIVHRDGVMDLIDEVERYLSR